MKILGLDIGSSSVGSAWIDTNAHTIQTGVSVFPAGVEERNDRRGAPKGHKRRDKRSQRKSTRRRADRKAHLRKNLQEWGWMPTDANRLKAWLEQNPWHLRRDGLNRPLTPDEFGRVLLHMSQQRGPSWFDEDSDGDEEKPAKVGKPMAKRSMKDANAELRTLLAGRTFGQFMADLFDERHGQGQPIRNRNDCENNPVYEFFPDRTIIVDEFKRLCDAQKRFDSPLAELLTEERLRALDDPTPSRQWSGTFKRRGLLFEQRNTYWNLGTLGRCDLEPSDRVCVKADMYAQEFLVLQDVNNIRVLEEGAAPRPLNEQERQKILDLLQSQKTAKPASVRKALGFNRKAVKDSITLNIDHDKNKSLNTNWFIRAIVGSLGEEAWQGFDDRTRNAINRSVCKFDPRESAHVSKMTAGVRTWWGLDDQQAEAFVAAWQTRPKPENRIKLSRRAVQNLLPYLRQGVSVTEARELFAADGENDATPAQRERYARGGEGLNRAARRFICKHPHQLPAPAKMANPVVRKAIHEVRRHVAAYMLKFGCKPDRVVVELAREARLSAKAVDRMTDDNKRRRDKRKQILDDPELAEIFQGMRKNQVRKAVDRILLCQAQRCVCAYSNLDDNRGRMISPLQAAVGSGLEIDHLIPRSRGGSNGLANKVLCFAATNRGKGNQTPKEWLAPEEFEEFAHRFRHWKDSENKEDQRRWANLHKDTFGMDDYIQSQLTDTAYASRQVTSWLEKVMYADSDKRHVFTTNGRYTSLLRHDWGLYFDQGNPGTTQKSRADHRHHAIDAVVIACSGPERIGQIASLWQGQEIAQGQGKQPQRFSIETPWGDHDDFRAQVINHIADVVVCHRPQKRKLIGEFHKDMLYGPILDADGKVTDEFTSRLAVINLKPNHLRMPDHWETLREKLQQANTKTERNLIRRDMLNLEDVTPGKSGVVRDLWCREELRACLRSNGVDPEKFTAQQIKQLVRAQRLRLADGQIPKKVTLRRVFKERIQFPRQIRDLITGERKIDPNPRSMRVYEGRNNHHVEIRQKHDGNWVGKLITTYEAAHRVRADKQKAVNRSTTEDGEFIMSLAIGETVYMTDPKTGEPGYFTVFKLDPGSSPAIHFTPHWDAGKAGKDENHRQRRDESCSARQLQKLHLADGTRPTKVWVGALGDVKPYEHD